jgi:hypothetical protein
VVLSVRVQSECAEKLTADRIESFTDASSYAVHWHNNWLGQPFHFDDCECFLLEAAVRYIDDFSLKQIVPVKFHENFSGIGHIHIPDFEVDPTISHIFKVWR